MAVFLMSSKYPNKSYKNYHNFQAENLYDFLNPFKYYYSPSIINFYRLPLKTKRPRKENLSESKKTKAHTTCLQHALSYLNLVLLNYIVLYFPNQNTY